MQDDDAGVIGHTMIAEDMQAFLQQPWAMVASDGGINTSHPRGAGTFPRVLGRFVRDEKWLSLPEAIRKMTSMPAARLKLKDRGTIAVGMKADLMLFDPATIIDRSTFEQPRLRAARHLSRVRQRAAGVDGRFTRERAARRVADARDSQRAGQALLHLLDPVQHDDHVHRLGPRLARDSGSLIIRNRWPSGETS